MTKAINYASGHDVLGWGLRNIVGMGEDPVHGVVVTFPLMWPIALDIICC